MFTPTLHCECTQPGLIDTMRKWSIPRANLYFNVGNFLHDETQGIYNNNNNNNNNNGDF